MIRKVNYLILILILIMPLLSVFKIIEGSFFKPQAINKLKNESFDYIVLGSSRGLTTLNTNLIDSITGSNGYNASMDDQGINSWSIMLEHIISNKIKFDTLILVFDAGAENTLNDEFSSNSYRWYSEITKKYVYEEFNLNFLKLLPWVHYNYWKNNKYLIPADIMGVIKPFKTNNFDTNGNYVYPNKSELRECLKLSEYYLDFNKSNQLKEIANKCEKNSITLVVYIAPYRCSKVTTSIESGFKIINHSNLLREQKYFYDDIHVNSSGRRKSTFEFIKSI